MEIKRFIRIFDGFLNDDQKKFISNSIFGNSFNWYHMEQSIETEVSDILLSHIVVQRPEHGQSLSKINSDYFIYINYIYR